MKSVWSQAHFLQGKFNVSGQIVWLISSSTGQFMWAAKAIISAELNRLRKEIRVLNLSVSGCIAYSSSATDRALVSDHYDMLDYLVL
jgi:hypothetical protein